MTSRPTGPAAGSFPRAVILGSLLVACALTAGAVSPGRIEFSDRASFGQARIAGLEVSPEGRLRPGLAAHGRPLDAQYAWTVLPVGPHVYVGSGDGARIYRFRADHPLDAPPDPADTGTLAWAGRGLEVYTLARDERGFLLAGVSPVGEVHVLREVPEGLERIETIAVPDSYIWRILPVGEDLWIATGSGLPGRGGSVYRWRKDRLRRIWRGNDPHVLSLARAGDAIYAGTQGPEGVLVRFDEIEGSRVRASVAWDPAQNELIDLAVAPDGALFACATTSPGRVPTRTPVPMPSRPSPGGNEEGDEGEEEGEEAEEESSGPPPQATGGTVIARIAPDGTVEEWVRARNAVRSLGFRGGNLHAGLADRGQVYRIDGPSRTSLVLDLDEKGILDIDEDWLATTGPAKLYRVAAATETSLCRTEVVDAGAPARWGVVTWEADGTWEARTRTGNTRIANGTWSSWSEPISAPGSAITSPPGRYIQLELRRVSRGSGDWLRVPSLTWQAVNQRPRLASVTVSPLTPDPRALARVGRAGPLGQIIAQLAQSARNLANSPAARQAPSIEEILQPFLGFMQVGWSAEDPDGDRLTATIEIVDEASGRVVQVADDFRGELYLLNARNFADGRYRARVTVTDSAENTAGGALEVDFTSEVFVVDNTAPSVALRRDGDAVVGEATDGQGRIASLHVLDAENRWRVLRPLDGICDQAVERFRIEPGDVGTIVKAVDQAGNVGYGRVGAR